MAILLKTASAIKSEYVAYMKYIIFLPVADDKIKLNITRNSSEPSGSGYRSISLCLLCSYRPITVLGGD